MFDAAGKFNDLTNFPMWSKIAEGVLTMMLYIESGGDRVQGRNTTPTGDLLRLVT
jgi:hypothetical protein